MRIRAFLVSLSIPFLFCISANSQTAISEEKRKAIAELVAVTKMDAQLPEITDRLLAGMQHSFPAGFNHSIDSNPDLTPEQREQLKSTMGESFQRMSSNVRQRIKSGINYKKYIEEAVFPLYDKYFTLQELTDLVQFYKTPTGQKVINNMPKLFGDAQTAAEELLLPQVLPIVQQAVDEELRNISQPPPPARREIIEAPAPAVPRDN